MAKADRSRSVVARSLTAGRETLAEAVRASDEQDARTKAAVTRAQEDRERVMAAASSAVYVAQDSVARLAAELVASAPPEIDEAIARLRARHSELLFTSPRVEVKRGARDSREAWTSAPSLARALATLLKAIDDVEALRLDPNADAAAVEAIEARVANVPVEMERSSA